MYAAAWPLVVVPVAVLVSLVLLAFTCLHCRDRGPIRSIPQVAIAEESADFRVIAQTDHTFDRGSAHQTSNHLQPSFSPAVEPGTQQRSRSFARDTDSNASYENSVEGSGYVNDDDAESDGYIIVVPGENQSGPSTPSLHSYENVPKKDQEYQNVDPQDGSESASDQSAQSDSDSDDDDMGNYVNVVDVSMSG